MAYIIGTALNDSLTPTNPDPNLQTTYENDLVYGLAGDDYLDGSSGYDSLHGDSGSDTLFGGNDHYGQLDRLYGEDGDDTLIATGWHGGDILEGGAGNDTYIVEVYENGFDPAAPTLNEAVGAGIDTVKSSSTWTLGANFEYLNLEGNSAINGTGNTLGNFMTGNTANNTINGGGGDDSLWGGGGNDSLLGEAGNDLLYDSFGDVTLTGGVGNDTYHIGVYGESSFHHDLLSIVENINEGTDTVEAYFNYSLGASPNVENLNLRGSADSGWGNSLNNIIWTDNIGNYTLHGMGGNDQLYAGQGNDQLFVGEGNDLMMGGSGRDSLSGYAGNDTLNGGAGADQMFGGDGNDLYFVDDPLDYIDELLSFTGIDTVNSSISYTLGDKLEKLILTGTSALNGTGNTLGNTLTGNTGNNSLNGDAGNDTLLGGGGIDTLIGGIGDDSLTGGAGADRLTGGTGKDRFVFTAKTEGKDTITDFSLIDDTINVSKLGFGGGLTANAAITAAQFRLGSAAGDSSDRFIYNKTSGALLFDADGTGASAQVQFAQLSTGLAMTNNDIFVIA